ncbi:hypothetical protein D3C86_2205910 [compost metagenome]
MQIVGQFIGFNPDEGIRHTVDRAVEVFHFHTGKLLGKMLLQIAVVAVPEGTAAADHIFP